MLGKIDEHFVALTIDSIRKGVEEKIERGEPYTSIRCIIPYYAKMKDGREFIYGCYGEVNANKEKTSIRFYPAREFPTGKLNPSATIHYEFTKEDKWLLYSVDELTINYQIGMAMGACMDMVNPFNQAVYIYDFNPNEFEQVELYTEETSI